MYFLNNSFDFKLDARTIRLNFQFCRLKSRYLRNLGVMQCRSVNLVFFFQSRRFQRFKIRNKIEIKLSYISDISDCVKIIKAPPTTLSFYYFFGL